MVKLVVDNATGLTWQKSGSDSTMVFDDARTYVELLNTASYGGYTDWRLPTLKEAMTLMEREVKSDGLYIDSVFDRRQRWIWTANKRTSDKAWALFFFNGDCGYSNLNLRYNVRAVRSGQ